MTEKKIVLPRMNLEKVINEIQDFIISKTKGSGSSGAVIGLSGGIDSTVTAYFAKEAFAKYNSQNDDKLELVGYILPSGTNKSKDTEDGIEIAKKLGIRYEMHSIQNVLESYRITNEEAFKSEYDKGNLSSRVRANILSTKSATENKLLLGTGNRDEDFGIGYYTLFGDGAVHISPIGDLSKRLVRQIGYLSGFKNIAKKIPSAGLEKNQTDFGDLGYDYSTVELVTEGIEQGLSEKEILEHSEVIRYAKRDMESFKVLYKKSKFEDTDSLVNDIFSRHKIALMKASLIHPPTPGVSLVYDGK